MELVTTAHEDDPARDMALTEVMLRAASARAGPEVVRIFRPGPTVAFGRSDRRRPGFRAASEAALAHGREPVVRTAGGQAAPYDPDCVVVEVVRHETSLVGGVDERYADLAELLSEALAEHGARVEVGELAGEYCPGRFSLHLPDGPKVAGIAQRVVKRASVTSAVLVVDGGDELRATISDVYAALEIAVDPDLAGALSDQHAGLSSAGLAGTLRGLARERYGLTTPSSS
jgi:octanoyl-[GcvH]:protein N-octanoyltransferase